MEPPDFAKRMLDFERLLQGERRETTNPDDIEHWHAVYSELLRFKQGIVDQTRNQIAKRPETRPELGGNDLPFLEAEMQRLRRGLEFWEGRSAERNKPG
jgi:hypothetical protein